MMIRLRIHTLAGLEYQSLWEATPPPDRSLPLREMSQIRGPVVCRSFHTGSPAGGLN
jgi:hypothetical protein